MWSTIWLIFITIATVMAWIAVPRVNSKLKKLAEAQTNDSYQRSTVPTWSKWVTIAVAVASTIAFILTVVPSMTYRLDPGESGVIKAWTGQVDDNATYSENGGLHFKAPWQEVTTFNVRNQQIVFQPQGGHDINITASTKDNASVFLDITVTYNQAPNSVVGIYKTYHTESEMRSQLIRDARGALQLAPTKFFTMEIKQQRPMLEKYFVEDLREELEAKYNITLTSVSIRSIWFTDDVQKNLDAVQSRNAEVEQAKASLASTRIKAEVTKTEAKAQADSDQIMRCGAEVREVKELDPVTGKETTAMQVVPVPMESCQNRLNEQVLTNKYIDALKEMAAQGNLIVVPQGFNGMLNIPAAK